MKMAIRIGLVTLATAIFVVGSALAQSKPAEPAGQWEPAGKAPAAPAPAAPAAPTAGTPAAPAPAAPASGAPAAPTTAGAEKPTTTSKPAPQVDPCGQLNSPMIMVLAGAMLVMILFSGRGRRKQEAARRQMLADLKKGDRVTSIGGIIGTVMDVREDEVVVKIDDDARLHLARWAIRGVGEESKAENPDQAKKQQDKDKDKK